ncbi:MAG: glycoside hydrolase family 25 protein, partial [Chloroflexi bacterium]|nr:glycoside hydrolase family 25 protein [Chloroflexota bacterium]
WVSAHARGLVAGSYHFCRPSKFTGSQEADYYLSTIGRRFPGELLAFDLEDDAVDPHADLLAYALDFKRTVQERTGYPPLFYSAPAYMEAHNLTGDTPEHRELAECGLWLANYRDDMPDPPAPWDFIAIWQHSETGRVPGVQGNCDLNWFNGDDIDRLKLYGEPEQVQQESV